MSEQIKGTYAGTIFKNNKDGFTFFRIKTKDSIRHKDARNTIVCRGKLPEYNDGYPLEIEGDWSDEENKFVVSNYKETDIDGVVLKDFLCNMSGVSSTTAKNISLKIPNLFEVILKDKGEAMEKLASIGIKVDVATVIVNSIAGNIAKRELLQFIYAHGGEYKDAMKLLAWDPNALALLKENPYKVGEIIRLPLSVMDDISFEQGNGYGFPPRMRYIVDTVLKSIENTGSTYEERNILNRKFRLYESKGKFGGELSETEMTYSVRGSKLVKYISGRYYNKMLYNSEIRIARNLKRLAETSKPLTIDASIVDSIEAKIGMKYAPQQRDCFKALGSTGVKVIIGGPGTGKTTTINGLMEAITTTYPEMEVMLMAPTGRAAQRMTESTHRTATTIHKGIELNPYANGCNVGKNKGTPLTADVIVVDEMSMVDTEAFDYLLEAVKDGALMLLVGDTNQLESVGAGQVLADVIDSECIEVYKLTEIYRQKGDNPIVPNAYAINSGNTELICNEAFQIITKDSDEAMLEAIKDVVRKYHKSGEPFYCQVLSPTHKGLAGVDSINKAIQEMLNPKSGPELVYGSTRFRENDKIIMTSNNYSKGYCNGDIGIVVEVKKDSLIVNIQENEIEITGELLGDIELAYSNTIHKSQGSEYPITVISLPDEPKCMLVRNLLYTAVTRAKEKVIIVTGKEALFTSIKTKNSGKRKTSLKERIMEAFATKG